MSSCAKDRLKHDTVFKGSVILNEEQEDYVRKVGWAANIMDFNKAYEELRRRVDREDMKRRIFSDSYRAARGQFGAKWRGECYVDDEGFVVNLCDQFAIEMDDNERAHTEFLDEIAWLACAVRRYWTKMAP